MSGCGDTPMEEASPLPSATAILMDGGERFASMTTATPMETFSGGGDSSGGRGGSGGGGGGGSGGSGGPHSSTLVHHEIMCVGVSPITKKPYTRQTTSFYLPTRYSVNSPYSVGYGAFGIVIDATDTWTGQRVAIKKISGILGHAKETLRTLREIHLLRFLKHENIVKLLGVLPIPEDKAESFDELYLVFELMASDLKQVLRTETYHFTEDHFGFWMYQILKALKYMESAHILHRDIKPENILVNLDNHVRVADLGLARSHLDTASTSLTAYVCTRYYRAPEVICDRSVYTSKIDMWSAGACLAEMVLGHVFLQGNDQVQQLALILHTVGSPTAVELEKTLDKAAKNYIERSPVFERLDFRQVFLGASLDLINFLDAIFRWSPEDRLSVDEALNHPFILPFREPSTETVFEGDPRNLLLEWEDSVSLMTESERRSLVLSEVMAWQQT